MKYLTILCSLLLPLAICGAEKPAPDAAQAYQIVLTANKFSLGPVGAAGTISATEKAFDVLLKEPDAAQQFGKILSSGTPAGQLYALVGLKKTDQPAYESALATLKQSDAKVKRTAGCMIYETTVSAVAASIGDPKRK